MRTYFIRINMNHIKDVIQRDYLNTLNHLHMCVVASLVIYTRNRVPGPVVVMENQHYHEALVRAMRIDDTEECLDFLGVGNSPRQFLQMHELLEEFFNMKLRNGLCYMTVTIDAGYHIVVTMKVLP